MQKYTRRSQFVWRDLHDVSHRFASIGALRLALYNELEDLLPDSEDYNLGYIEGKQQKKKWLVSTSDLEAMYSLYEGKPRIPLWCDGKRPSDDDSSDDEQERRERRKVRSSQSWMIEKMNWRAFLSSLKRNTKTNSQDPNRDFGHV